MKNINKYLALATAVLALVAAGLGVTTVTLANKLAKNGESSQKSALTTGTVTNETENASLGTAPGELLGDGDDAEPEPRREEKKEEKPKNKAPSVAFRDDGRYLPPVGAREIAVTSVNVPRIHAEIAEVPSANIVQMLALEEGAYNHSWKRSWGPKEVFVEDISGVASEFEVATENRLNEEETTAVAVKLPDGEARNGVYFLAVRRADCERNDSGWGYVKNEDGSSCYGYSDDILNPNRYRVVCVTDLGISVRKTKSGLLVWATSLTKGAPVGGAKVDVYSSANVLVAKGETGGDGLAKCETVAPGEPFAVVVSAPDGSDRSFLAMRGSMRVGEETDLGARDEYLEKSECNAFVWTERGIYRHDEPILLHALVRDGTGLAPRPFPVEIVLVSPTGSGVVRKTVLTDALGALADDSLSVAADQPSGAWRILVKTPGDRGVVLGERNVKVEEFAPPQVKVAVVPVVENADPRDFAFAVTAEHLFGGPAKFLGCEGAIVYEDAPFAPKGWEGWRFGDGESPGLKPNFRRLDAATLDEKGAHEFHAPLWADAGRPKAAVRATAQGTVFEDGGRPATARATRILHYYGRYIGATLGGWVRRPEAGLAKVRVACVAPDGSRVQEPRRLAAKLERIESVYTYRRRADGWATWDCTYVKKPVADGVAVEVPAGGEAELEIPADKCGDYELLITGGDGDAPFSTRFYLSDWGDDEVRAPLSNPTKVTVTADKAFYRPGDVPRLVVKSPFAGTALLGVYRDDMIYTEVVALTNATSEIELRPVDAEWRPSVDVKLSVVQSVENNAKKLAVRAHGELTLPVRLAEDEVPVTVEAKVDVAGGNVVDVDLAAASGAATATMAVVTLVDEGINLLTDEPEPDPAGFFSRPRRGDHPLYDLYHRILPVIDEGSVRAGGVKTGGDGCEEMLGRVSPVPTRRFRPLATWERAVPLAGGRGHVRFSLPEFVGEVRVTAVASNESATGAGAVRAKVAPRLVIQPDAPRFVAPGDRFEISLPLSNRSGSAGEAAYEVEAGPSQRFAGSVKLGGGDSTVLRFSVAAPGEPGEMKIRYAARGLGETHEKEILLPVRPAVAWRETAGVRELAPGEKYDEPQTPRFRYTVEESPVAKLKGALEWLADYPHGCLEQTSSRVFPLVAAGDVLADFGSVAAADREKYVLSGVRRVSSMIRERDFVMWPDCDYAPWDREVSLYAAHFLVEAERSGARLSPYAKEKVMGFLARWALSPTNSVAAYACHTLALAGKPDTDRMLKLYDRRKSLDLVSRARLARAFVETADPRRAEKLLRGADAPASVKEASFALLALLALDPSDGRIPVLAEYLASRRGGERYSWGTTGENAHALLALGAYYRARRPAPGTRFVCWRRLELPDAASVTNETSDISATRRYLTAEGKLADLSNLKCGDLLVAEITVCSSVERDYSDLVVEDLFAGAFEPVHSAIDPKLFPWVPQGDPSGAGNWVMRCDARDDRMLVFSRRFHLKSGESVSFRYPVRVVSAGEFVLPGVAVEAMYQPSLRARTAPARCRAVSR